MTSDDIRKALDYYGTSTVAGSKQFKTLARAARFAADVKDGIESGELGARATRRASEALSEIEPVVDHSTACRACVGVVVRHTLSEVLAPAPVEQVTCDVCDGRGRYIVQSSRGSLETDEIVCRPCGGEGQGGVR